MAAEVAPVMRNSEAEKGIAGKLSTKVGNEAWKQAGWKTDKCTESTNCDGKNGKRERKTQRLSSKILNESGRKKAEARIRT